MWAANRRRETWDVLDAVREDAEEVVVRWLSLERQQEVLPHREKGLQRAVTCTAADVLEVRVGRRVRLRLCASELLVDEQEALAAAEHLLGQRCTLGGERHLPRWLSWLTLEDLG